MGSAEAGERNAVIYTLVANCRMHGIEPYTYLKDVLTRLPRTNNQEVEHQAPLNWQKNRSAHLKAVAPASAYHLNLLRTGVGQTVAYRKRPSPSY